MSGITYNLSHLPTNKNILALGSTVQKGLTNLRGVVEEVEKTFNDLMNFIVELQSKNDLCESQNCFGSESIKKVLASKEGVIQNVASALTSLNESKNFNVPPEIFNILCGESTAPLQYYNIDKENRKISPKIKEQSSLSKTSVKNELLSPIKDHFIVDLKEESLSEIEGTPTGRISPIIQSRRLKSSSTPSSFEKDLKKTSTNWRTPEKTVKLSFPTPTRGKTGGKLRQARLNLIQVKKTSLVDLTNSPEQCTSLSTIKEISNKNIKLEIKKESLENEDTILPSPTTEQAELINFKLPKSKLQKLKDDITSCETNDSISILQNIQQNDILKKTLKRSPNSPSKLPLVENINVTNIPNKNDDDELDSSLSVLRDFKVKTSLKRKPIDKVEPVYKEPTARKKLERQALPGWSCDECELFYAALYKNDPEMLAKKMNECSKHRGRNNPIRPKTPEGLWNPRWNVPEDTEEFNRRNNAV